jgi:stage II sporulation protein AA (anti-sigma F factor antagonist)
MQISEEKKGSVLILSLSGRVEMLTSPQLKETIISHINLNEHQILFDLSELEYISSSGLGVLLHAAKMLQVKNGRVVLCALKAHIEEVFKICGFDNVFPIFDSREQALQAFQ